MNLLARLFLQSSVEALISNNGLVQFTGSSSHGDTAHALSYVTIDLMTYL